MNFISAVSASLLLAGPVFAAIPPAENLLPADTLVMFTVPDFSALRVAGKQSPEWLLWNDPAMKPFRDDFEAKWNDKVIAPLEQNLGVKIADYVPLLQGQLTFAITQNGWDGDSGAGPAMLLLLDTRGKTGLLATNLAALRKEWTDAGKPVRTEILHNIKFSAVTLSSNAPAPLASIFPRHGNNTPAPATLYIGQYESLLIAGTSLDAIEGVAAHLTGGAIPQLSGNAQFAADQLSQFHGAPLYYAWFNAHAFFNVLSQIQQAQDSDSSPRLPWNRILLASGLGGLNSATFTFRESREGAEIEFFVAAPETTRQGVLKMVAAASEDAAPPPFVPADAVKFWRWRVDGQKSWAELEKTLAAVSPAASGSLNTLLAIANATAQQQDPGFDIRKNLIANLGDDWISFQRAPSSDTLADLRSAPSLFLFAANNAPQAVLAIKTVAGMAAQGQQSQPRDFLGRKIYTITVPASRRTGAAASHPVYLAASGGYVALTSDISMIESYLRSDNGKTQPLSQIPGLLEAAQHVGGTDNGLFGYQNQRETARALFAALKSDPAAGAAALNPLAALPGGANTGGLRNLMDFSLLPDYGTISKYFNFTVYGGKSSSDGLDFKFFTPRPPALN